MDAAVQHIPLPQAHHAKPEPDIRPVAPPQSLLAQSLIGTATDGDLRRGLLRGITTDAPARSIMNSAPRTIRSR